MKPMILRDCAMYIYALAAGKAGPTLHFLDRQVAIHLSLPCLEGGRALEGDMGLRPLNFLGFFLVILVAFCGGAEQQRAEAADAYTQVSDHPNPGTNPHRILTTVSVAKPSYPTVTTPTSASTAPSTMPLSTPMGPSSTFPTLAAANGGGGTWCVASQSANPAALQVALDYACAYGADCSAIQPGGSCFNPDTAHDHASYAFNSYYQKNPNPTSCDFGGAATITTTDPSSGSCQYPASSGGAQGQNMVPPPAPTTPTPTTPMTPTPTTPMTPTPTPPDTGTPVYGSMTPPDYGSRSPPGNGSNSPPDYSDVGAAPTTMKGRAALALLCALIATISLSISK